MQGVLGDGPGGYTAYRTTGCGAAIGEKDKEARWKEEIRSLQDRVAHDVKFVPFCVEVGGTWGSKAKTFFNTCVALAGDDRDNKPFAMGDGRGLVTECVPYLKRQREAAEAVVSDHAG